MYYRMAPLFKLWELHNEERCLALSLSNKPLWDLYTARSVSKRYLRCTCQTIGLFSRSRRHLEVSEWETVQWKQRTFVAPVHHHMCLTVFGNCNNIFTNAPDVRSIVLVDDVGPYDIHYFCSARTRTINPGKPGKERPLHQELPALEDTS